MGIKGAKLDTWQKRVVQETVERFEAPFTAADVCTAVARSGTGVSRATVYRLLAALCAEGRVKEVSLPDGRRVCATMKDAGAMCIIECSDCGHLSACAAPDLGARLDAEARKRMLSPIHTAVYMSARCARAGCEHRREKQPLRRTRRKPRLSAT